MELMSIYKIILVTLPENICNLFIAFLLTGDRLKLPGKNNTKPTIVKFVATVFIFTFIQFFGRYFLKDITAYFILNTLLSTIVLGMIYKNKVSFSIDNKFNTNVIFFLNQWKLPFIQVGIIFLTLAAIETIYIPPILKILDISSMTEAYQITWVNLLLPQIDRFFQILIISFAWQYKRFSDNIENYSCKKPIFLIIFTYSVLMEFGISYLYVSCYNSLSIPLKILFFIIILPMGIINILFYSFELEIVDKIYKKHTRKEVKRND